MTQDVKVPSESVNVLDFTVASGIGIVQTLSIKGCNYAVDLCWQNATEKQTALNSVEDGDGCGSQTTALLFMNSFCERMRT